MDLDAPRFGEACRELADAVREFEPDLVIGIANGGAEAARAVAPHLPGSPKVVEIALQRPSTAVKQRLRVGGILPYLPARVRNGLRWLEVELREARRSRAAPAAHAPTPPPELAAAVKASSRTLVVDDTVDSGRTLNTAVEMVRSAQPAAELRTAVLASTFRDPPVRPDYCLFDRTLVRFPWSFDA